MNFDQIMRITQKKFRLLRKVIKKLGFKLAFWALVKVRLSQNEYVYEIINFPKYEPKN